MDHSIFIGVKNRKKKDTLDTREKKKANKIRKKGERERERERERVKGEK